MAPRKKKRSRTSDERPKDDGESTVKKPKSDSDETNGMAPLDFSSPRTVFETLIHPTTFDDFFSIYWEKKPLLLNRSDTFPEYAKYGEKLFSKSAFEQILGHQNLQFETDVNVVKFMSEAKRRDNLNGKRRVTLPKFQKLFQEQKGTMQFHQPQRFQDILWKILENLESFFGCLVGSNVYITPSESQGLPPHHDDVEVFIMQLEGKKRWRLYKPIVELPQEYSGDLSENEIGNAIMDFILKPGDLLYFPRGTIHQADTVLNEDDSHSTHITVSTYQCHTWGDYLLSVFPTLLEDAIAKDVSFRKGLPTNFLRSAKIPKSMKLNSVIDMLLQKIKYEKYIPPEGMIEDFMKSRLPPYGVNTTNLQDNIPNGPSPGLSSKIRLAFSDHVCYLIKNDLRICESDEESDETDSKDSDSGHHSESNQRQLNERNKKMLFVYSSLFNDKESHMMGYGKEMDSDRSCFALKFPPDYVEGLHFLKSNSDRFVTASEVPLTNGADIETLIRGLWSSHLLEVQPSSSGKSLKALKVD